MRPRPGCEVIDTRTGRVVRDDDDPILKDHHKLRVPMMMADGQPNPSLDPLQRSVAEASRRRGVPTNDRGQPLFVGDSNTVDFRALFVHDGSGQRCGPGLHRPGSRYVSSGDMVADAAMGFHRDALEAAMDEERARSSNAWRGTHDTGQRTAPSYQTLDEARRDAALAYEEVRIRDSNLWRTQDAQQQSLSFVTPGGAGPNMAPTPPWAGASLLEGTSCTLTDGRRGKVIRGRDGKLICVEMGGRDALAYRDSVYASREAEDAAAWKRR
jgi:hypothetical protein